MTKSPMVVQFAGYSNSGKTTLLTQVIRYLSDQGLRVAVIKHDGGHDVQIDQEGKDTWRFHQAGSPLVAIQSKMQTAWFDYSPISLAEIIERMAAGQPDLILIEGFKREAYPKLVLIRTEEDRELMDKLENPMAIVSWLSVDHPTLPVFSINDHVSICQFLYKRFQEIRSQN
ncbi:molybdopterin-guanine dinucleotide biosynthesis protein B [Brevibacillus ginsengisoli]|uniref:molybdopterin-guanine dinucleotide biosynthesis protein B n=1 Tax=Brevibacillus ginsengisoli TaxID=363854 RepID=UPI003CF1DA21